MSRALLADVFVFHRPGSGLPTAVAVLLLAALVAACGPPSPTVEGPDDFVGVVDETLAAAHDRLPAQRQCLVGFSVRPDWHLEERATYADGVISIRVPATAPRIQQLVVHELAHHLDATCAAVDDVRPRFQSAQGNGAAWSDGPSWAETPAEQFAEAVTLVVLGRQRANNVALRADAVEVTEAWAGSPP